MKIFEYLTSLFYPSVCAACGTNLGKSEEVLCLTCSYSLPETNFHLINDNPVAKLFWGRIPFENASAYYYFSQKSKVQKLIHKLKYRGRKDIGIYLGKEYGKILKKCNQFNSVNMVIPVPLYKKKERKRGFNQSKMFALGLSKSMGIEYDFESLIRTKNTESQTGKKRQERMENVLGKFTCKDIEHLKGKHVLLVDDVITSGSTIEASAKALLAVPDIRISIAGIAFAGI
jgi:ComF family protein